jgi:hypothetical protein
MKLLCGLHSEMNILTKIESPRNNRDRCLLSTLSLADLLDEDLLREVDTTRDPRSSTSQYPPLTIYFILGSIFMMGTSIDCQKEQGVSP